MLGLVFLCGIWGCAQGPANGSASSERLRALEAKIAKLEDDFRAAVAVREQLRKKLVAADTDRDQLNKKLEVVVKEREDLRQQLTTRTAERDQLQGQFDQFRKGIKTLLGQVEPQTNVPPVTAVSDASK
jgi:septal ring factor EnvC (AmiA/AmiB activator)